MEITRVSEIDSASNVDRLVINLQDENRVVAVYDRHLRPGGTVIVKHGKALIEFDRNPSRYVTVDGDRPNDVRIYNAMEVRVANRGHADVHGTPTVGVYGDGHVYVADDCTRTLNISGGTAIVDGNVDSVFATGDSHTTVRDVGYLETARNAWVRAGHVLAAQLRGSSFSYLRSVADGRLAEKATAKVVDCGSLDVRDHAGAHVGGRTYVLVNDRTEIVATGNSVVRRIHPDARVHHYDDALVINDDGYEDLSVAGPTGGDDARELSKRVYKATTDMGYSGKIYGRPTKWEVGGTTVADDWEPTRACGYGLHVCRLPGDTLNFLDRADMIRRPKMFEVMVPDGGECIRLSYCKDKVSSAYVVREVDVVGRPIN